MVSIFLFILVLSFLFLDSSLGTKFKALCFDVTGYAILEERPMPSDLVVRGAPYIGPPIVTVNEYQF